jgi:hypothetical protein
LSRSFTGDRSFAPGAAIARVPQGVGDRPRIGADSTPVGAESRRHGPAVEGGPASSVRVSFNSSKDDKALHLTELSPGSKNVLLITIIRNISGMSGNSLQNTPALNR